MRSPSPRLVTVLVALGVLAPSVALAQAPRAGVVTTLEGNVTARRVALPAPVPLKFKDDVFLQDTVATGDRSLARMLLGGKAVVTVRERTVLTITEVPGKSTIDLESGKFSLAVAREKMRPGEEILIRTPNAVAGVRGTVVITEVTRQGAQSGGGSPAPLTSFYVLRGSILAQQLDLITRQPFGTPLQVGAFQAYSQAGGALGRIGTVSAPQIQQILSGLQPTGPKGGADAGKEQVKDQAVQTAVSLVTALTGGDGQQAFLMGGNGSLPMGISNSSTQAPIIPKFTQFLATGPNQSDDSQGPDGPTGETPPNNQPPPINQPPINEPPPINQPSVQIGLVFAGTESVPGPAPVLSLDTVLATSVGAQPLVLVNPGAEVTMQGPLLLLQDSVVTGNGGGIDVHGTVTAFDAGPFLDLDGTQLTLQGHALSVTQSTLLSISTDPLVQSTAPLFRLVSGSSLTTAGRLAHISASGQDGATVPTTVALQGSLLEATDSTIETASDLVGVFDGGVLATIGAAPLVSLGGDTTLTVGGDLLRVQGVGGTEEFSVALLTAGLLDLTGGQAQVSGSLVHVSDGGIVDAALLEASAPLLKLGAGTSLTVLKSGVEMVNHATLASTGSLFQVNGGTLTFMTDAVRVQHGSMLHVTGSLFTIANNGIVNIMNGAALSAHGGSTVNITGGLVTFGAGGGTFALTNSLCSGGGCVSVGNGINVLATGGAAVTVNNPIVGSGTLNISPNAAAIVADGPNTKVTIGPPGGI